jgi:hypothetical protein
MNEDLMYAMHVAEECKKRAERAERRIAELERERDEARKALVWAWKNAQDYKENAPPDIYAIFKAARAAAKDDE